MQRAPAAKFEGIAARRGSRLCAIAAALVAQTLACSPSAHRLEPYRSDAELAAALESRASAICSERRGAGALPPNAFTTDGCSMWPDASWVDCCVEHDIAYWCGGPSEWRRQADEAFRQCLAPEHGRWLATSMYYGVRAGGSAALPFPWRWAYGWTWRSQAATSAPPLP